MYIEDSPTFASKEEQQAWADFLSGFGFTHFVTLPFAQPQDFASYYNDPQLDHLAPHRTELAERYVKHLGRRIFGRRAPADLRLFYIGFPESFSRRGGPTHFHFHILLKVPVGYEARFNKYKDKEWQKAVGKEYGLINTVASPNVVEIYDVFNLAAYVTKHSHREFQLIFDLPKQL